MLYVCVWYDVILLCIYLSRAFVCSTCMCAVALLWRQPKSVRGVYPQQNTSRYQSCALGWFFSTKPIWASLPSIQCQNCDVFFKLHLDHDSTRGSSDLWESIRILVIFDGQFMPSSLQFIYIKYKCMLLLICMYTWQKLKHIYNVMFLSWLFTQTSIKTTR